MKTRWMGIGALSAVFAVAGCGGSVSSDSPAGGKPSSGGTTASGGTGGKPATGGSGGSAAGGSGGNGGSVKMDAGVVANCDPLAEAIASKIGAVDSSCTAVVRVSADTLTVIGYALICGSYGSIDETSARDQAKAETGYGLSCFAPSSLTGPTPSDDFVFFQPASLADCACCGDGWVTAVSARNAMTVLGGAISTGGQAPGLTFPTWSPASDLGSGCTTPSPLPPARGFDLTVVNQLSTPLDDKSIQAALGTVWQTALAVALAKKQYFFDAVVLRYSAGFGGQNPEFVVLLNTGWLE